MDEKLVIQNHILFLEQKIKHLQKENNDLKVLNSNLWKYFIEIHPNKQILFERLQNFVNKI